MRATLCVAVAAVLLGLTSARGGQPLTRDGNWWREQSPGTRVTYTLGMIDGVQAGQFIVLTGGSDAVEAYLERSRGLFGNPPVGQLVDGLNVFYADFRNRNIWAASALVLVGSQINGMTAADLETWAVALRKNARPAR